jgi:hypothetical protein
MNKRTIVNILLAFIIVPIIKLVTDYINIEIKNDHTAFSGSFLEYETLIASTVFVITPLFFLLFVLLPYNMVILKIGLERLNYLKKVCIFLLVCIIVICLLGTFMNVWFYPYWKNVYYLIYLIPCSFLFAGMIHVFADNEDQIKGQFHQPKNNI